MANPQRPPAFNLTPARERAVIDRFISAQDNLVLQAADLSLETIANMAEKDAIDVAPSFQRRERWSIDKQSSLIESFLLNVPVPPIYLMEDDFGTYSVIDGKQRVTAIHRFMKGKMQLQGLKTFADINGCRFADLPRQLRNSLEVRPYLRVITLLRQSDENLKYEVFTRLNEGGEPLNAQELRNVIFRGPLNDLIISLGRHPFLKSQLKIRNEKSPSYQQMEDAEFVLRFMMLRGEWKNFSGDYRASMNDFMRLYRTPKNSKLGELEQSFKRSIDGVANIWGEAAFKRPSGKGWRDQMLAGMYDAQMVAVDAATDAELNRAIAKSDRIVQLTRDLFVHDDDFEESVRRATNTPNRVEYRITEILNLLKAA